MASFNRNVVSAFLCALLLPSLAFAHAHLKASDPKENAILKKAPSRIELKFSEPLETTMSTIEVKDEAGASLPSGPVTIVADDPRTVEIALKDVQDRHGAFQVVWKAVSKDTHKMKGSFKFSVDPKAK